MLKNDLHVGSPRSRVDGLAKVTGAATYAAEFPAADLAHSYIVESGIARGKIIAIHTAAAEAVPGVIRIFTHENRPRSAAPTSELQSRPVISYAVFCLQKQKKT
mgnify:CR=1 FL=1